MQDNKVRKIYLTNMSQNVVLLHGYTWVYIHTCSHACFHVLIWISSYNNILSSAQCSLNISKPNLFEYNYELKILKFWTFVTFKYCLILYFSKNNPFNPLKYHMTDNDTSICTLICTLCTMRYDIRLEIMKLKRHTVLCHDPMLIYMYMYCTVADFGQICPCSIMMTFSELCFSITPPTPSREL